MADTLGFASMQEVVTTAKADMDPRLQLAVAQLRSGARRPASASTDENEVAVIARVSDLAAWQGASDVRDAQTIGQTDGKSWIVTGRIPVPRIERIRNQPFVQSLKAAQPMRAMLADTTAETEARPAQLPAGHHVNGGAGVVVGVVDYGGDFAHRNFLRGNGKTRLLSLWDQNGGKSPASPYGYGVEHDAAALNLAINQADPYAAIGYEVGAEEHGTHVMDIAAGNGGGSGTPGVAPNADLIFVNVTHDDDPTDPLDVIRTSFGDSVTLLESLKYIFEKAGTRPAVINVSLGTNGGPHDGTTLVDQGIDALVTAAPNRAVVIAASNSYDDGIHAAGKVAAGASVDLRWEVAASVHRPIEMELWYPGADRFKVELIGPNGAALATAMPGETKKVEIGNALVALVANRLDDPNNHDNMIGVFLMRGMPGGGYVVRLTGITVTDGSYHAWIERDNAFQSEFAPPHDNRNTIGSISCGKKVVSVGSYDAKSAGRPLSYFSSAGPTRDGRQKPEVSAPGHNVWAANSGTRTGVTRMSGTSMAAPCVAGIIALMFEEAVAQGLNLSIDQTLQILAEAARRRPPTGAAWHDRYGHGRLSASKAIAAVIALGAGGGNAGGAASNAAARPKGVVSSPRQKPAAAKPRRKRK